MMQLSKTSDNFCSLSPRLRGERVGVRGASKQGEFGANHPLTQPSPPQGGEGLSPYPIVSA